MYEIGMHACDVYEGWPMEILDSINETHWFEIFKKVAVLEK